MLTSDVGKEKIAFNTRIEGECKIGETKQRVSMTDRQTLTRVKIQGGG